MGNRGSAMMTSIRVSLLRSNTSVMSPGRRTSSVRHVWLGGLLVGRLSMHWLHAITMRRCPLSVLVMTTTEMAGRAVLTTARLRHIWLHRHATRDDIGSYTATGGILRGCRAAEPLRELLYKRLGNIVDSDVNSVGNTKDNKRAFTGVR